MRWPPLAKKWIVLYATILHVVWGVTILLSASAVATTPISGMTSAVGGRYPAALALLLASGLIVWAMRIPLPSLKGLLLCTPQQFLTMLSAVGAIECMARQAYADGVPRPFAFIFADQLPAVLAAVIHTVALVDYYGKGLAEWFHSG